MGGRLFFDFGGYRRDQRLREIQRDHVGSGLVRKLEMAVTKISIFALTWALTFSAVMAGLASYRNFQFMGRYIQ